MPARIYISKFRDPPDLESDSGFSYNWSMTAYYDSHRSIRYRIYSRQQWTTVEQCFDEAATFGFERI